MQTRRMILSYALVMLFLMVAAFGTGSATLSGEAYLEAVQLQSRYTLQIASSRGTIYDRNLQPLTNREKEYVAAVSPSLDAVSRLYDITDAKELERIQRGVASGKPFSVPVETPVSTNGIRCFEVYRHYEDPQPAANLIGYLQDGVGVDGIERCYDDFLSLYRGDIQVIFTVDALGRAVTGALPISQNTYNAASGGIALTIDRAIQIELETACKDIACGAAVLLSCADGAVLASSSFPAIDPNHLDQGLQAPNQPFINRVLCAYTPGSVWKLLMAGAALEQGIDEHQVFTCTGSVQVDDLWFTCYDHTAHGKVNLHTALRNSCNGYFIQLLQKLDLEKTLALCRAFGIGETMSPAKDLSVEAGHLDEPKALENPKALANFAFGQGSTTVTPLQAASVVQTLASGGVLRSPYVYLGKVDHRQNLLLDTTTHSERQVISAETAEKLCRYMESTAQFGTGRFGAPENSTVGIKTGTAETGRLDETGREIYNYWYAGYVCDEKKEPQYALVILEETAGTSHVPEAFKKISESLGKSVDKDLD